ncbi:S41 family peptidase [Shewanella sp. OPT22]|nr:S41 family peptidase [Shewanella sp. OPT22]
MSRFAHSLSLILLGGLMGISITLIAKENVPQPDAHYDLPLLADVIDSVENYYVDPVSRKQLITAALKGIFAELDGYSEFLTPTKIEEQEGTNQGQYKGFGFEVDAKSKQITVLNVFDDSPADKAGVLPGDKLLKLNQLNVQLDSQEAILDQIRVAGKKNTTIELTFARDNSADYNISLIPAVIHIDAVETQLLSNSIGYMKLNGFQNKTHEKVLESLARWHKEPLQGIIIDLRSNPGGLLHQAIKVADLFIDNGIIVSTQGRFSEANSIYHATPISFLPDVPMLVLIDKHSASAAEVLAAALQQNKRAKLIGEKSFGKGSVQGMIPTISNHNRVKLTIANYLTPKGENIHKLGIVPDINLDSGTGKKAMSTPIINDNDRLGNDPAVSQAISWITTNS